MLEDFGIVTQDDPSNVIDQYKVRRERAASRVNVSDEGNADHDIQTLYFDGRKDKTFKLAKKRSRWYKTVIIEEHITIVTEPGSNFLTHITLHRSTAKGIAESIVDY